MSALARALGGTFAFEHRERIRGPQRNLLIGYSACSKVAVFPAFGACCHIAV